MILKDRYEWVFRCILSSLLKYFGFYLLLLLFVLLHAACTIPMLFTTYIFLFSLYFYDFEEFA